MKDFQLKNGIFFKQYRISLLKEIFRKSIHLCSAFVPALLKIAYWPVMLLLFLALLGYSVSELLRINGIEVPVVSKITAVAARKRDENKFVLGPVTLVIGIIFSSLIWQPTFARIGIYALAFGDGLASLVGKFWGRIYIPGTQGKTVAGSLTCFLAVFISSFCVCSNSFVALILATVAMVVEVLPLKDFDNVLIPIFIGGLAQFLIMGTF